MTAQHERHDTPPQPTDPTGTRAGKLSIGETQQLIDDAVNESMELVGTLARGVRQLADINQTLHRRIARLEQHLDLPPATETPAFDPSTLDLSTLDSPGWEHRLT